LIIEIIIVVCYEKSSENSYAYEDVAKIVYINFACWDFTNIFSFRATISYIST